MRPRSVGEILDAGIKLYVRNTRTLMGLAAVVVVPLQTVAAIVLLSTVSSGSDVPSGYFSLSHPATTQSEASARLGGSAVLAIVSLLVSLLTTAACVKAVSDLYLDQPTGVKASLRFAVRRLPALLGMEVLMILGLMLAFIVVIIPGIWLYVAWSVAAPALLIERFGPWRALGRSRRLVKGRWWATAGVLLVATILVTVVSGAVQAALVGIASLPSTPSVPVAVVVTTVASVLSTVIAQPFHAAVTTTLYYDLRVRHEGYDLQLLAEQLGLPAPSGAELAAQWPAPEPVGPESVGQPGGPPFWPPPPGWKATG